MLKVRALLIVSACLFTLAGPTLAAPLTLTVDGQECQLANVGSWDSIDHFTYYGTATARHLLSGEPFYYQNGDDYVVRLPQYTGSDTLRAAIIELSVNWQRGYAAFQNTGSVPSSRDVQLTVWARVTLEQQFSTIPLGPDGVTSPGPLSISTSGTSPSKTLAPNVGAGGDVPPDVEDAIAFFLPRNDSVLAISEAGVNGLVPETYTSLEYDLSTFIGNGTLDYRFSSDGDSFHDATVQGDTNASVPQFDIQARVYYYTAIPEPFSAATLCLGGLALLRRKRR